MPDIRVVLLMLALLPGTVLAQSEDPVPPPLVDVEDAIDAAPEVTWPAREGAEVERRAEPPGLAAERRAEPPGLAAERRAEPLRLESELLALDVEQRRAEPTGRVVGRVVVETLSGSLAG
ncbi:hypothetical protein ACLESO_18595, partial [Pyxidicoccus sp. 3LG]